MDCSMQFKIISLSSKDIQTACSLMAAMQTHTVIHPLWMDTSSQMTEILPDLIQMNWFVFNILRHKAINPFHFQLLGGRMG